MQRKQLELKSFLPSIIRTLAEGMTADMYRRYAPKARLTVTEWRIMLHLAEHGELTATQIVDATAMEKSKVSRAIAHLETRDLVYRHTDQHDQRSKRLKLTPKGEHIYTLIVPTVLDWEKELLQGLDIAEYRDLLYLLGKLDSRMREMQTVQPPVSE